MNTPEPGRLCLECGLCCNGALFGDVKLQSADNAGVLNSLGLTISKGRFRQPCVAWKECRCQIYLKRPEHCRKFECLLLQRLQSREIDYAKARQAVGAAKERVLEVRQ